MFYNLYSMKKMIMTVSGTVLLSLSSACVAQTTDAGNAGNAGTPAQREALFDYIVEKTMAREAFSEPKNIAQNLDIPAAMEAMRQEVVEADTDEALYYALSKLSATRRDKHLGVDFIKGGLEQNWSYEYSPGYDGKGKPTAPVRFAADFSTEPPKFFVSDITVDNADLVKAVGDIAIGDVVVRINGQSFDEYIENIHPYYAHSTPNGFYFRVARFFHEKDGFLPPSFYSETFDVSLKRPNGETYDVSLPYAPAEMMKWQNLEIRTQAELTYDGYERVLDYTSFDVFQSANPEKPLIVSWYGFRDDIVTSMDKFTVWADKNDLLDADIIWDGSRSRGGGRGAYAIQRLSSKPFRTTFGNLRLSDWVPFFIKNRRAAYDARQAQSDGTLETVDDGSWLVDWLEGDVTKGIKAGQTYSNSVPFKSAHLPSYSDGILQPAALHFKGEMVCLFSPQGGSHLDQFAAMVKDNKLCTLIGMSSGGYSNTWEAEEELVFPGTNKKVVNYMWSAGHTIRPNGEVLEGNPAEMDQYYPITKDNFSNYHQELVERAQEILAK